MFACVLTKLSGPVNYDFGIECLALDGFFDADDNLTINAAPIHFSSSFQAFV
jgi:hypothetical protein